MEQKTVNELFENMTERMNVDQYNYFHFTRQSAMTDLRGTVSGRGIGPGCPSPDFELEDTQGNRLRLSDLKGMPVVIRFGSISCPATTGTIEPFRKLFFMWGKRVKFLEVFVRQAHPGQSVPAYETYEQKMEDAQRYQQAWNIPWQVLVDDLEGRVHQVYGGMPDPCYIVSSEGRISFYNVWTHAPSLERALHDLFSPNGACVVRGGIDRIPHVLAPMVNGWFGLALGLPQSYLDMQKAVPGLAPAIKMGSRLKPVLDPVVLRAKPLPLSARAAAGGAGIYIGSKLLSLR